MKYMIYKAQRANETKEWVFGYYVVLCNKSYRIYSGYGEVDCKDFYPHWYEVDPKTVSQFTGLTDMYGYDIYEGDILEVDNNHGVVKFDNGSFYIDWIKNVDFWNGVIGIHAPCSKIIGNIYNNKVEDN